VARAKGVEIFVIGLNWLYHYKKWACSKTGFAKGELIF
jgi:hypothetical protein